MSKIKRVVTLTMEIDKDTHKATCSCEITENGKLKEVWNDGEIFTVISALCHYAEDLSNKCAKACIQQMMEDKEEK